MVDSLSLCRRSQANGDGHNGQNGDHHEGGQTNGDHRGSDDEDGDDRRLAPLTGVDENMSEISASAANASYDGKHPLLEFAMQYFRDAQLFAQQVQIGFIIMFALTNKAHTFFG